MCSSHVIGLIQGPAGCRRCGACEGFGGAAEGFEATDDGLDALALLLAPFGSVVGASTFAFSSVYAGEPMSTSGAFSIWVRRSM